MASCVVGQIPPLIASGVVPGTSASPGFQFGRAGDVGAGTYLQVVATVPSNTAGVVVPFTGIITRAFVTCENADTFTVAVQRRVGLVFTTIATITMTASRKGDFDLSAAVTDGDEIVCQLATGNARNIQVGIIAEQSP